MDGGQGAGQTRGGPQFLEGQIGLFRQQRAQLVLMTGDDAGLAAGTMVLGAEVADSTALLKELLDQAQRNPKTAGDLRARVPVSIVGRQNPFAQV